MQQFKLGGLPSNVPAIEDKPKENGQTEPGDQVTSSNKVKDFNLSSIYYETFFGIIIKTIIS